jgi:hypothetical protein
VAKPELTERKVEAMAFEVFDLKIEGPEYGEMRADPLRFFKELVTELGASEGRTVTRLMVDDTLLAEVTAHRTERVQVAYGLAPEDYKTTCIVINAPG